MLPLSQRKHRETKGDQHVTKRDASKSPLLDAPHALEYGANAAYSIEEVTGNRSWWKVLVLEWFSPILALGNTRHLQATDLFSLSDAHRSVAIASRLAGIWTDERDRKGTRANLLVALLRAFGQRMVALLAIKVVFDSLAILLPPLLIKVIVKFSVDPSASPVRGLCYTLFVAVSGVFMSVVHRQFDYFSAELALFVQSSVSTAVFQHTLVVSPSTLQHTASDDVISYVTTDSTRLMEGLLALFSLLGTVVQFVFGWILLYSFVGNAMWAGLITMVICLICAAGIEKIARQLETPVLEAKDERLQLSQEFFMGIKSCKLLTWEKRFAERITKLREGELHRQKILLLARGATTSIDVVTSVSVTAAILFAHVYYMGGSMDAQTVLPMFMLLLLLVREPFSLLPKRALSLLDAYMSLSKVNAFLVEPVRVMTNEADPTSGVSVVVKNADFKWDTTNHQTELGQLLEAQGIFKNEVTGPVLHHINFYASRGELHTVVGAPKSGKSSFLAGIVGVLRCSAGEVTVHGHVAYVTHDPFMLHASIRDNICFGHSYEEERYARAVKASCLKVDWPMLPQGDQTIVSSDNGVGLTGSQRVRVALARSIYQNADVYVFDDILSSMDHAVAKKIFKKCMQTALKEKIVIMATRSFEAVKRATNVFVLARGTAVEAGDFKSLIANKKWGMLSELVHRQSSKTGKIVEVAAIGAEPSDEAENDSDGDDESSQTDLSKFAPVVAENAIEVPATDDDAGDENVRTAVLLWLLRALGERGWATFAIVSMLYLSTALFGFFSISTLGQVGLPKALLQGFITFSVLLVVSTMASTAVMQCGSLHACQYVHHGLIQRLARAPMAFFDATPTNRVVALVSKDLNTVDAGLTATYPRLFAASAQLLVTVGVLIGLSPWLMFVSAPLMLGLYRLEECVDTPMRDLERIHQATVSPLQSCIAEVLYGRTAIRMYKADHLFIRPFHDRMDTQHQAFLFKVCANIWTGIRVDALHMALVSCVSLAAVHTHASTEALAVDQAGHVGVALIFAFAISPVFFECIKTCNETRHLLMAVGKLKVHSKMPVEATLESTSQLRPHPDWPSTGAIVFDYVSLRYRQGLPRILRGVSFSVSGGTSIAIIGNPGSGKKSIFAALTRLVELSNGTISIDGVDVSKIGLHDLRSKIAVLSPAPTFFAGSIRSNLDGTLQFSDEELWRVLQKVQLREVVLSLDETVNDGGSNYSDGERRLLSLARAMLRRPKIMLIDEGDAMITSFVESEAFDRCVLQEFPSATKLMITQRTVIATVVTTVLVMVNGQIAECGTSTNLQKNARSIYRTVLEQWKRRDRTDRKKP